MIRIEPRTVYQTHRLKAEESYSKNNAKDRGSEFDVFTESKKVEIIGQCGTYGEIRNLCRKTVGKKSLRKPTLKWEGSICSES